MSSISFSNLTRIAQNGLVTSPLSVASKDFLPHQDGLKTTAAVKSIEPTGPGPIQGVVTVVPSSLDLRYAFNAQNQSWELDMLDAVSGDVVRKMTLKGFSKGAIEHPTHFGHGIDRVV